MEENDDIDIVLKVLKGKKFHYHKIVEKYQHSIYSCMMRFTRSEQQAQDLTQEVFMKAYTALNRFDGSRRFFPWLFTIAMNTGRDWARKMGRQPEFSDISPDSTWTASSGRSQEAILEKKESLLKIKKALERIHPDQREAVILRYKYEMSIAEISEIFNISASATKMRIVRGLKQLKENLSDENKK